MKKSFSILFLLGALLAFTPLAFVPGCTTNQTTTAYKGVGATKLTIDGAMAMWGAYVQQKNPGTNAEQLVWQAYQSAKVAELAAASAAASLAASPTNTAVTTQVVSAFTASYAATASNLVNVIQSFGVVIPAATSK